MERDADAMIGNAILREIVGANFFGAIAGADLSATFGGDLFVLLVAFQFVKASAENAHRFRAIFNLRFFVLLRNDSARRQVSDANGGIRRVYGLTAGA